MDIKQLEYFVKVCDCGSFSKAADRYYISTQGINSSILRLEKELKTPLLIRSNNGVTPTVNGEYLYRKAKEVLSILKECDIHFHRKVDEESVSPIAMEPDMLSILPITAGDLILNKYKMTLSLKGSYSCEADLLNGHCNLALVNGSPFNPKLSYMHCFTLEHIFVVNRLHELAGKPVKSLSELCNYRFVCLNSTFKDYGNFYNLCTEHGFIPQVDTYVNSLSEAYGILNQRTDLIGVSYDCFYAHRDEPDIVSLSTPLMSWPFDVYLAYLRSNHFTSTDKNFISDFLSTFADQSIL